MSITSLEQRTNSTESNQDFQSFPSQESQEDCDNNGDEMKVVSFKPRKMIAKMKANNRKGYKRKVLEIIPIIYNQVNSVNKYVIYGSIELETFYKDYSSPYEMELIDMTNLQKGVQSIEKSANDMNMTVNYFTKSLSGIRDFQFLIDHYSQIPDLHYWELAQQLKLYQKIASDYILHTEDIAMRIKQRLLACEEVQEALSEYRIKFDDFVRQNVTHDEFYISSLGQLNLDFFENEQKYTKISFALLSLLGIEHRNFEMTLLRNTSSYLEKFGQKRLGSILQSLKLINDEKYHFVITDEYMTIDNIKFYGQSEITIFKWDGQPSWMKMEDNYGILIKINIPLAQIKSILELRSQMSPLKQIEYGMSEDDYHFEYTVESEIFLEKYYPSVFSGENITKKSLELKQEMMESFQQLMDVEQSSSSQKQDEQKKQEEINSMSLENNSPL